jgi:ACS family hexuronate transporter-like MFS transporter
MPSQPKRRALNLPEQRAELAHGGPRDFPRADGFSWGICWLMFVATMLNYMDRQTVSLVRPQIRERFAIGSDAEFGWIIGAFSMIYALLQIPAGYLVDRWDLRRSYAAAVVWWSLAAMATALAPNLSFLITCRALLGVGESFNWPCALRVTARVLPPADRSLGNGIFNSGAAAGAVVTPLLVTVLTAAFGWRTAFLVPGALGLCWVAAWLVMVRGQHRTLLARQEHQATTLGEVEAGHAGLSPYGKIALVVILLASGATALSAFRYGLVSLWFAIAILMIAPLFAAAAPAHRLGGAAWSGSLGEIVRNRRFWIMVVVFVTINICWHFLVNWCPAYLNDERHLDYKTSNFLTAVPFVAAALGNLGGGWLASRLAALGWSAPRARRAVLGICLLMIQAGIGVSLVRSTTSAVVLLSIMAAGTAAFMANSFAFAQDVAPRHTGLVVGYLGGLGNLFVAGFQPFAGAVKDVTGSFSLIFWLISILPVFGLAVLFLGWSAQETPIESTDGRTS